MEIPYFLNVSRIREIIYCADGICDRETYVTRRKKIHPASMDGDIFGEGRRLFAIMNLGKSISITVPLSLELLAKNNSIW